MKHKRWWIAGAAAIAAAAGGWAFYARGPEPAAVQLAAVTRQDVQAKATANGRIQAQKKVEISATIAGQVTQLAVKEGDRVKKGQFLLQIDSTNPRATARSTEFSMQALLRDLESAKANLELARADFRRAEENHQAGIIPIADYERSRTALATSEATVQAAERRVEQARATLEGAQDTLAKTTVRAPMDGIVTAKRVEEGEVAVIGVQSSPGTVLLTISDMSVVEAEMEVDEALIPRVEVSQEALIRIDAYPNRIFSGIVTEVGHSPIVNTSAPNEAIKYKVKIQLQDPPADIKPGLSVQADILTGFSAQALVVPIQALILREIDRKPGEVPRPGEPREEEGVYLMEDGKARFQKIKTGLMGELSVEVLEGLRGDEQVITGPFRALRSLEPGDPVEEDEEGKGDGPPET